MFDKIRQLNELRKMKNAIAEETTIVERNGIKITINGSFNIEEIIISSEAKSSNNLGKDIKNCFNDAVVKIQTTLARKFSGLMG